MKRNVTWKLQAPDAAAEAPVVVAAAAASMEMHFKVNGALLSF